MSYPSFAHMFHARVAATPDDDAFEYRAAGQWHILSWGEVGARARHVSCGLHAMGLDAGDRCGILSSTRMEWILADLGILCGGFATTTVYSSNTPEECSYILGHSESRVCFVEDQDQVDKLLEQRDVLPALEQVVVFEGRGTDDGWVITWEDFLAQGVAHNQEHPHLYEERADAIGPDDLATLIYTSGTTGPPKGVMLAHDCWVFEAEMTEADLGQEIAEDDKQYLFLPLAHSFGKVLEIVAIHLGVLTTVEGDIEFIVQGLQQSRPTFMAAVPRVFEKVYNKVVTEAKAAGGFRYKVFRWAVRTGDRWARAEAAGERVGLRLQLAHRVADRLVFRKVRDALGGKIRYFVSGGAPLSPEIARFFYAAGIFIAEGYGLTETSAGSVANKLDDFRFGTVGKPGTGVDVRVDEEGEIQIKGRGVMRGYFKDEEKTEAAFTEDGWFRTGDVGEFDEDGFLKITGRIKDLIITAGGKNIAPQNVENQVKARSPFVQEIVMHGDKRNFCVALVCLDEDAVAHHAREQGWPKQDYAGLAQDNRVKELVMLDIHAVNLDLARYETIKDIHLLDHPLTIESGELTPSHKVKRRVVEARYKDILDRFYEGTVAEV